MDQAKLNELLNFLLETAKSASGIAKRELPIIAKEIVDYEFYSNGFFFLFWGTITSVSVMIVMTAFKKLRSAEKYADVDAWMAGLILNGIVATVAGIATPCYLDHVIKSVVSPRVVVLEKIKGYLANEAK